MKILKRIQNDKIRENFYNLKNKIYNGWESWKVFELLMIIFYSINYINCVVLKRLKFITLGHFLNEKSEE